MRPFRRATLTVSLVLVPLIGFGCANHNPRRTCQQPIARNQLETNSARRDGILIELATVRCAQGDKNLGLKNYELPQGTYSSRQQIANSTPSANCRELLVTSHQSSGVQTPLAAVEEVRIPPIANAAVSGVELPPSPSLDPSSQRICTFGRPIALVVSAMAVSAPANAVNTVQLGAPKISKESRRRRLELLKLASALDLSIDELAVDPVVKTTRRVFLERQTPACVPLACGGLAPRR